MRNQKLLLKPRDLFELVQTHSIAGHNIIKLLLKAMIFSTQPSASSANTNFNLRPENMAKSTQLKMQSKQQKQERFPIRPRTMSEYTSSNTAKAHLPSHKTEYPANQWVRNSQFVSKTPQISPSHGTNINGFNAKNRRCSENNSVEQNGGWYPMNKSVMLDITDLSKKRQMNHAANFLEKPRIISCNKETPLFLKRTSQNNGENEDSPQSNGFHKHQNYKQSRKKIQNWEEDKNFGFQSKHSSSDQNRADIANLNIEIPHIPKAMLLRKHSDNENVKKVPSFLTNNKYHKNSADVSELMRKDNWGIDNFVKLKDLGKGAFGKVILAMEKQIQFICAIKIISKECIREDNMMEQLIRQIKIQMRINHPNIIKVYGFFDDILNLYIVMECALDGQLSDFMEKSTEPIPEATATVIFHQICQAVSILHSELIIHRDLKPENVMLHQRVVKICDFGWSVYRGGTLRSTFCGTPIYLCPQILIGDVYDESIDIWALGVMLYEMLFKSNPFRITCRQQLVNIINEPIYFNEEVLVSEGAKDIVKLCLSKRATERPNIRELLLHQFLINVQVTNQFKR